MASCPEHAIIDNSGVVPIDRIDKKWYIELAQERARKFKGIKPEKKRRKKKMDEEITIIEDDEVEMEVKPKTRTKKVKEKEVSETPLVSRGIFNLANVAETAKVMIKDGYNPEPEL